MFGPDDLLALLDLVRKNTVEGDDADWPRIEMELANGLNNYGWYFRMNPDPPTPGIETWVTIEHYPGQERLYREVPITARVT